MMFPRTKARRQFGVIAGTLATALTLAACGTTVAAAVAVAVAVTSRSSG